jgi:hypothetical protein
MVNKVNQGAQISSAEQTNLTLMNLLTSMNPEALKTILQNPNGVSKLGENQPWID